MSRAEKGLGGARQSGQSRRSASRRHRDGSCREICRARCMNQPRHEARASVAWLKSSYSLRDASAPDRLGDAGVVPRRQAEFGRLRAEHTTLPVALSDRRLTAPSIRRCAPGRSGKRRRARNTNACARVDPPVLPRRYFAAEETFVPAFAAVVKWASTMHRTWKGMSGVFGSASADTVRFLR